MWGVAVGTTVGCSAIPETNVKSRTLVIFQSVLLA